MDVTLDKSAEIEDSDTIDNEHQVQIGMLDAFCKLLEEGEGEASPEAKEMLDQLAAYTEVHFMSEQLLMRMYAYPDYDDHVMDHEAMTEYINDMTESISSGKNIKVLATAITMRNFLLSHISSRDKAFSQYLITMKST
jgi:hemerythrin